VSGPGGEAATGSYAACGSKAAWLNGGLYINVACTLPAHPDRTHEARISGFSRGQQQETAIVVRWTRPPDAKGRLRDDTGTACLATFLFAGIAGALLWLAVLAGGQQAMCAIHDDALRYCSGYDSEEQR
jgi:hypothetical protein